MKFFNDARLRAGTILREWKEKQEAKKALHSATHSEHGHGRFFLLHVPATATICAAIVEWYWALLFCIEATGHVDWNYETSTGSNQASEALWNFAFSAHWPVLLGLVCATVPIVMLSMVWLPVQFAMRGTGRWRRGTVILCGLLANVLVIVSGTVVMNYNRQEQVREALVVEQTADAQRTMLTANVDDLRGELDTLMNHRSTYVATAASVGATAYERDYVSQARASNDPRLPLLERALGSARRADELRDQIRQARAQVAQAAPVAAAQANVEDTVGRELNTFAQYVEVWRPPFVAVICTLIGIFGAWWTLALLQGLNPRDVLRSGWADEGHRIEDLRDQEPIAREPMKPPREVVTDAETGEELVRVRESKPRDYWRKVKKGKPQRVEVTPEPLPDETGFQDKSRTAVTLAGEMEVPGSAPDQGDESDGEQAKSDDVRDVTEQTYETGAEGEAEGEANEPIAHPTLSEEQESELAAFLQSETPVDEQSPEQSEQTSAEPDQQSEHVEPREEPETDPGRMIAAE